MMHGRKNIKLISYCHTIAHKHTHTHTHTHTRIIHKQTFTTKIKDKTIHQPETQTDNNKLHVK